MTPDKLRETLEAINALRAEHGQPALDEMPTGVRCNAWRCPVARALNGGVASGTFLILPSPTGSLLGGNGSTVETPEPIAEFIRDFDHGEYPELEES